MKYYLLFLWFVFGGTIKAQQLYFPPLSNAVTWETTSPELLGWCTNKLDSLYDFLEAENSKGFLVLKDGKIVLEKYFGTFTKDSNWYWASAGKSLTSLLVGIAQEEGYLSINDSSSKYLGNGWTNCTPEQEGKITIRNQITMTSGLDDGAADNHCTTDSCLIFKADAGTRWAYHNAPYTLLDGVINASTGQNINAYTQSKVRSKTGINGIWVKIDYDNVYVSTPRSMARYGLLAQNNFIWSNDTLLHDTAYKNQMVNSSQSYNLSYGYLWWLNGKASYMVPTSQIVIPGSYAPHAPTDMFAAIGKNGQIISISQNKGLIVVRMGDAPDSFGEVPTQFCDKIWQYLNKVICNNPSGLSHVKPAENISIYPNPATSQISVSIPFQDSYIISIINILGEKIVASTNLSTIDVSMLKQGVYFVSVEANGFTYRERFVKQ
jgi:CubicO group peptidase (beta-lactamase class C family)